MSHSILSANSSIGLRGLVLGLSLIGCLVQPAMAQPVPVPMGPGRVSELPVAVQTMDKTVVAGQAFDIQWPSNASTGYSWILDPASSQGLDAVTVNGDSYVQGAQLPGAPGAQVFRFIANRPGTVVLAFLYRRPWSPDVDVTRAVARVTVQ